ncbi:MAG TPA: class E sortase [Acidimicrobiales bacterium]|nr:class E sortase [Acidimicrobiales bacterium]
MDWRRMMRGTGRALISAGVLILLFVAYQLWGTGVAEARSQRALKGDFVDVPVPPTTPGTTAPPVAAPPPVPDGEAVAVIRIPKIGVEKAVVEGVALGDLKKGPGHYRDTPMPGQPGNAAIAGHRTTYGAPFYRLDELEPGDRITVATRQGTFDYEVRETKIVRPSEVSVLDPTPDNRLTLTTCHPRFSARQRLIVVAALLGPAAPAPVSSTTTVPPGTIPGDSRSLDAGLSGDEASNGPAVLWGLLAALVWLVTWAVSKRWRKWPAYAVGTPVFLVVLFVFFENFSRLLPANY